MMDVVYQSSEGRRTKVRENKRYRPTRKNAGRQ